MISDKNFIVRHELFERRLTPLLFNALSATIRSYPIENTIPLQTAYQSALRIVMRAEMAYLWTTFLVDIVGDPDEGIIHYKMELFIASLIPSLVAEVLQTTLVRARKQEVLDDEYIRTQRGQSEDVGSDDYDYGNARGTYDRP